MAAWLLPILLFAWGALFSAYQMYSTPDRLKAALEKSGVYETLVSDVLSHAENEAKSGEQQIATNEPDVKKVIQNAASPEYLQTQVEGFLDGIYSWLQGESEHLALTIDLSGVKTELISGLTQVAHERLASLPVCDTNTELSPDSFDPLSAECIPRGADKNLAVEKIRNEIDQKFKDPVLTQDDLQGKDGVPLEEKLSGVRTTYNNFTLGLWVGGLLILLCTAGVILLSPTLRSGLKRASLIFMSVGGVSVVLALFASYVIKKAAEALTAEGSIQHSVLGIINQLADGFRGYWLWYGIIILVLGAVSLVTSIILKNKSGSVAHDKENIPETKSLHTTEPEAAKPKETK